MQILKQIMMELNCFVRITSEQVAFTVPYLQFNLVIYFIYLFYFRYFEDFMIDFIALESVNRLNYCLNMEYLILLEEIIDFIHLKEEIVTLH